MAYHVLDLPDALAHVALARLVVRVGVGAPTLRARQRLNGLATALEAARPLALPADTDAATLTRTLEVLDAVVHDPAGLPRPVREDLCRGLRVLQAVRTLLVEEG
jgi:hypothetical protein